ncbi:MAG: bifunctional adenosylcobinamide kinase/adenosylcobinamide-phosphate guanylyltransferase [Campylobacterota bacterium]|nr:bifunctional adenosylcobinamide kinase/adenosylcobinamide-phosphate guanylyltransferase [Campylobacterota bacterium]
MKILYIGGQKSGKSYLAEKCVLKLSKGKKPYYIATYDNSYGDKSMKKRINIHHKRRVKKFNTIERTKSLHKVINNDETYLVDCLSMWLLNHIELSEKKILKELKKLLKTKANIVFVLNDVSSGVIPLNKLSRKYVDLSGLVGQMVAKKSNKVIKVEYGLQTKLK